MIGLEEFVERLCRLGADRGPRAFPRRRRDRQILMKSLCMLLDGARRYDEAEINERILAWKRDVAPAVATDHVTIRRLLVDHGLLERSPDGSAYRRGYPPAQVVFDLEVDDVDVRATIAAYQDWQRRQPRRGRASGDT